MPTPLTKTPASSATPSSSTAAQAPPPPKRKSTSEIDDIFSGKKPKTEIDADGFAIPALPVPSKLSRNQKKRLKEKEKGKAAESADTVSSAGKAVAPLIADSKKKEGDPQEEDDDDSGAESEDGPDDDEVFENITDEKEIRARVAEARTTRPKPVVETIEFKDPTFSSGSGSGAFVKPPNDAFGDSRGLIATRRTDDGFGVFTTDELAIGKGGDTPQCPFDCWCCY
ncbi:uncharacterized protein EV422DRAFT_570027 [Fimicolochytrium jonesii]|uniref:uncharacterized protein n=1 Tax=Fimicolochytrium jonesii TaxID=1396493 RepID=UPI0022FEE7F8|nr:uncharacterized protein EV422DRAFT_570027 [Fimicolochytrium jonesii]KAI8818252.1 hypothetical protein EV422DRAFT_570027 [Fimicolochytrium jonesii]